MDSAPLSFTDLGGLSEAKESGVRTVFDKKPVCKFKFGCKQISSLWLCEFFFFFAHSRIIPKDITFPERRYQFRLDSGSRTRAYYDD
jgi:hypothetical protein